MVDPLRQSHVRLLANHYWAMLLVIIVGYSVLLSAPLRNRPPIEWQGFVLALLYLLAIAGTCALASRFVRFTLPDAFLRLVEMKSVSPEGARLCTNGLQRLLDHSSGLAIPIIFAAIVTWWSVYALSVMPTVSPPVWLILAYAILLAFIVLGYGAGIVVWKAGAGALTLLRLTRQHGFSIWSNHPDRCGGLSPVGDLLVAFALVPLPLGVFFTWIVAVGRLTTWLDRDWYPAAEPWMILGAVITWGVSVLLLLCPLYVVHRAMKRVAGASVAKLAQLGAKIAEVEERVLREDGSNPKDLIDLSQSLRSQYVEWATPATLPIDPRSIATTVSSRLALGAATATAIYQVAYQLALLISRLAL